MTIFPALSLEIAQRSADLHRRRPVTLRLGEMRNRPTQTVQQYNYFSHMVFLRLLGNNVRVSTPLQEGIRNMSVLPLLARLWSEDQGQDIAEYAVMLAVILVLVVGTVRMIGSNANGVFSQAASSIQ